MKIIQILFLLLLIFPSFIGAENYKISVTRKDSNLYKIDGKEMYIKTRYCYEYAYSENAFLKMSGSYGEIIFANSGEKYDVEAVYAAINQSSGEYSVTVTRRDNNWYEIWGKEIYIKTRGCLSLALGKEAVLSISSSGYGTLYIDGYKCSIEGLYSKVRL